MKKACSRLEWNSIRKCFRNLGFSNRWIDWFCQCTCFKIIINGKMRPIFNPERGMRQGNPLSLYIFIICTEYLGHYINYMANQGKFGIGIRLNNDAPKIPYLIFANDCIILYRATKSKASKKAMRNIKQIVDHYGTFPGQLVNYYKSKIEFSKGVSNADKNEISQILQISSIDAIGTYLGCIGIEN